MKIVHWMVDEDVHNDPCERLVVEHTHGEDLIEITLERATSNNRPRAQTARVLEKMVLTHASAEWLHHALGKVLSGCGKDLAR